ncbi:MAG: metallopeptidase family protein [Candidatus Methylacidiphilales bacterium]|nr:metallopeptidase family protein [Candidatus Methylacidiphilales bacterium]
MKNPTAYRELEATAELIIEETLAELPAEVAVHARQVPVLLRPEAEEDYDTGIPREELMGLFSGLPHAEGPSSDPEDQPRITLFLRTIWDEAGANREDYAEEVRLTLLHELGHYLGWDEEEIEERGLG